MGVSVALVTFEMKKLQVPNTTFRKNIQVVDEYIRQCRRLQFHATVERAIYITAIEENVTLCCRVPAAVVNIQ